MVETFINTNLERVHVYSLVAYNQGTEEIRIAELSVTPVAEYD